MGIGSCWVGAFDDLVVSEILLIPYGAKPVAIVPLGLADESPDPPARMELSKIIHKETW